MGHHQPGPACWLDSGTRDACGKACGKATAALAGRPWHLRTSVIRHWFCGREHIMYACPLATVHVATSSCCRLPE